MPRKTVLNNGVRIVTETIPWATSVSIGFWIGSGSRDERPTEAGYAHMVEHMMFKGTATRSARDIAETMDRTGGQMNAFTTKETTCYHCRVLGRHVPLAMELLTDMLLNATFSPEDLARERAVILEEINQVEDTPEDLIHDLFDRQLFGEHPLAGAVIGTGASVAGAEREDLLGFVARHYRPSNLVVALAGNVVHEDAVQVVAQHLGTWTEAAAPAGAGTAVSHVVRQAVPVRYRADRIAFDKEGEQVHVCLGVPGLRRGDPDRYALDLLDTLLGGGMSSRLFQKLREEEGLVYSTYSFSTDYFDAGLFGCYAATGPERAEQTLDLMLNQLVALRRGDLRGAEVERAKEQIKGGVLLGWESTGTRMGMLAGAELAQDEYLSAEALSARYDAVSLHDVRRVAEQLLLPEAISVVTLGPSAAAKRPKQRVMEAIG